MSAPPATRPRTRGLTGLLPGLVLLGLLGWGVAEAHQAFLDGGPLLALDEQVTAVAVEGRAGVLTSFLAAASWTADLSTAIVIVAVLGLAAGLRGQGWRLLWFPALAGAGGLLISAAVKLLTARDRPPGDVALVDAIGYAFPSGHALRAMTVFGALALVGGAFARARWRRAAVWTAAGVLVIAVGAARVYLGVHWLTDVLGGYLLGGAWLWWAHRCTAPILAEPHLHPDAEGAAPAVRSGP